ncbi:hypothetical protein CYLTODRAFT_372585 [Cylindrobasidium torrendii FP15055 ss-10]|uniref:DUF6534 domain-containing protein n=1 Tax=Cylindrobasidium torrendii FP15055 ss-10 TaxID=1314674 RepID=A0A0D7BII2_9AGAR|nr:hypothetical protein CYLTODRAFT_372585 [Cylindrobasidium torrendii FP15055 ss-10]
MASNETAADPLSLLPPAASDLIPNLDQSTAPLLVGWMFNMLLYGVLFNQTYWYYMSFPRDSWRLKGLVIILLILESIQSALVFYDALEAFALHFGSFDAFNHVHMAFLDIPILTSIISCIVQSFFAMRIYKLSKNWFAVILVELVALVQVGAAFAAGIMLYPLQTYTNVPSSKATMKATETWLASSAACDILIATLMVYFLSRQPAHFKPTKLLVSRMIRLTVETGSITAFLAVVTVILFSTTTGSYYACLGALAAKLYSNVCLAILNSRISIREGREEIASNGASQVFSVDSGQFSRSDPVARGPFSISVSRTEERHVDTRMGTKSRTDVGKTWSDGFSYEYENGIPLDTVVDIGRPAHISS